MITYKFGIRVPGAVYVTVRGIYFVIVAMSSSCALVLRCGKQVEQSEVCIF